MIGRLLVGLLGSLLLIAFVAYLAGRSIVSGLDPLVAAANSIAAGRLRERVPVRGRDEFATLGRVVQRDGGAAGGAAGGSRGRAPAPARGERPLRRRARVRARPRAAPARDRRVGGRGDAGGRRPRDRRGRLGRRDRRRRDGRGAARVRADGGPAQLRAPAPLRLRLRRRGADDRRVAGRPGGRRARERPPAPDRRAAGARRRAHRAREPASGRQGARRASSRARSAWAVRSG